MDEKYLGWTCRKSPPKNCRCKDIQGKAQNVQLPPREMEFTDLFYDGLEAYDCSREDFVETTKPHNKIKLNVNKCFKLIKSLIDMLFPI